MALVYLTLSLPGWSALLRASVTLRFNPTQKNNLVLVFPLQTLPAESDGRERVQFLDMKVDMKNIKSPKPELQKSIWTYLDPQEYPEMIFHNFSGHKNELIGNLSWRGIDRKMRTTYTLDGDGVRFKIPTHLIDFAFEEAPPVGLKLEDNFIIEVEVPVRYVRTSETR